MKKLEEELRGYALSDHYPFHMPGHKRRGGGASGTDITEIDGFDNLHAAEGLLREEMRFAAGFYGARDTAFLVNGSTCGILAAISASVPEGGRLLVPRGAHISVYHAAYLRNLELIYAENGIPEESGYPDAVLITSPSYEGCVSDVAAWAGYAGRADIPLIVDEAHGAHFSMHPYFPVSAVRLGADLVVQSTHKTLPALTQTALLHNVTGRVPKERIDRFLRIYETSSPSYVLMASVTSCIHACAEGGPGYFGEYAERLRRLREELSGLRNLRLIGGAEAVISRDTEFPPYRTGTRMDPGKLLIRGAGLMTGPALYDRLRLHYHLQPEMKTPDHVLLMTSVMDTEEGFERLRGALLETDRLPECGQEETGRPERSGGERLPDLPDGTEGVSGEPLPPARMRIREAWDAPFETVPLDEAGGRICAEFCIVYPPDSPVIVPGEEITSRVTARIRDLRSRGLAVTGAEGGMIRCISEPLVNRAKFEV